MLKASDELRVCADAHEKAVRFDDEYGMKEMAAKDPDIKYIIDVGANVGASGVMMMETFPEAQIIECEPESENMKYCRENTDNKLIYVEKAIVGYPHPAEVLLNVCGWAGNHHVNGAFRWDLFMPMGSKLVSSHMVPAISLKEVMDENNFPRIDFLKIDCEGLEGQILQGFKPYMHLLKHFRGEWHGDQDIPLIQDALEATHNVVFDHKFTTHGEITAEPK